MGCLENQMASGIFLSFSSRNSTAQAPAAVRANRHGGLPENPTAPVIAPTAAQYAFHESLYLRMLATTGDSTARL